MADEREKFKRVTTIKIWYDTRQCSETDIMEEIFGWPDIEDVKCVGTAITAPENQGTWPEDE